ncbi:hypothetical protein ACTWQB_11785 [Piscibacillus sp. B03]|uniref:hypothetical protein n=1 Tax=Piscibacillus sp. B03 TaxID=3457430 RepID=UPI003FCDAD0D
MNSKLRIFTVSLFLILLCLISVYSINAEDNMTNLMIKEIKGEIITSDSLESKGDTTFNALEIQQNNGIIYGKGVINKNGNESNITFKGELYPVIGKSPLEGKLILGDLKSDDNFNILQFKIEKDTNINNKDAKITLILEDKKNKNWLRFEKNIDIKTFEDFHHGSKCIVQNKNT